MFIDRCDSYSWSQLYEVWTAQLGQLKRLVIEHTFPI